jgi:hypothetical protein
MESAVDPAVVDAIGQILGKGGSAASVILAYFGYRIFRSIAVFLEKAVDRLDKFYYILDRLDRHLHPDASVPRSTPALPSTIPINRGRFK